MGFSEVYKHTLYRGQVPAKEWSLGSVNLKRSQEVISRNLRSGDHHIGGPSTFSGIMVLRGVESCAKLC